MAAEEAPSGAFRRTPSKSARGQGAKLYELRAATSLCGVLQEIGKGAEGHLILSEIYSSFTEGFDSPDLRLARAALDELNPRRLTR